MSGGEGASAEQLVRTALAHPDPERGLNAAQPEGLFLVEVTYPDLVWVRAPGRELAKAWSRRETVQLWWHQHFAETMLE